MRRFLGLSALLGLALLPSKASATLVDASFVENPYVYVASQITGTAWAPDASNRLFVTIKTGAVRVVKNGALLPTAFSTDTVYTNSECGLIGIAFDPAFATNGYVYLFETVSSSEQQIVRYTATGDVGTNRTVIKPGLPTDGNNHDGGGIAFGPDGMLYFAIGDLGSGTGVDANLTSLAAKVSRITKTGATPLDNPFHDGAGPNADEIWGRGHRNPFTMTFHPVTGSLWVNDVGTSYEKVFRVSRGDHAGYNDYEINQPASGYIRPTIHYRTNSSETQNIQATGAVRNANVTTFTLTSSVRLHKGQRITIARVANASFNGTAYVKSIPTSNSFTIDQVAANASSGGGTVATLDIGGVVNGGVFYDGTQFPASHRGNFFFGDYNSGRLVRATMAADQTAETVDLWGSDFGSYIDADVGPDGALYVVRFGGNVVRIRHAATTQAIVVNKSNVRTSEGGSTAFAVSLATAPTSDVTVTVTRAGDTDVTASAATLTFTTANWSTPQFVTVSAADDADADDDLATFSLASTGLTTQTVTARVNDDEGGLSIVTSAPSLTVTEGSNGTFTVRLSAAPTGSVQVSVGASGDPDVTASPPTLTFNGTDWSTPKTVTVSGAQDTDATNDTATIALAATGLTTRNVAVTVNDDEPSAPAITSTAVTTAVVNAPYTYDVNASGTPAPTYSLDTTVTGMTIDATTGVISWTPAALGPVNVTVRAKNGVAPETTQSFVITVAADTAPTAIITKPDEGAVVSGTMAEFYGDGTDDVATVKAEFAVDGVVIYTDNAAGGHYHVNGTHNQWDTTTLSDGPHVVRMTVFDTSGLTGSRQRNVIVANGDGGVDASADASEIGVADTAVDATAMETSATPDASVDDTAVAPVDASVADAGNADTDVPDTGAAVAARGCGCRTSGRANETPVAALVALVAWVAAQRKRSRRALS